MNNKVSEIKLDGVVYISVKSAATLASYTSDYVGQLCRSGKLEATRIGRVWYVREDSIIKHRELTLPEIPATTPKEKIITKRNIPVTPRTVFKSSTFVVYKRDDSPLLPDLKQIETKSVMVDVHKDEKMGSVALTRAVMRSSKSEHKIITAPLRGVLQNIGRVLLGTTSFAAVFLVIFSLNSSYASSLIKSSVNNFKTDLSSAAIIVSINEELLEPYRLVATEINDIINLSAKSLFEN